MCGDIQQIDVKVLNRSVNAGLTYAKNNSPVITGWFRKKWYSTPAQKRKDLGVVKVLGNSADYAQYVNYGHRTVAKKNGQEVTTGYVKSVKGDHLLERAVIYAGKQMEKDFEKEIKEVQAKYDS